MGKVLDAAGHPNEYNTATFLQYDTIIQPDHAFGQFLNDPVIQRLLHVRGNDIPGINFIPENVHLPLIYEFIPNLFWKLRIIENNGVEFQPSNGWQACNNQIVSNCDLLFKLLLSFHGSI